MKIPVYEGWRENKGILVPEEVAVEYAIRQIRKDPDMQAELVDWFYSGNWFKGEADEDDVRNDWCD